MNQQRDHTEFTFLFLYNEYRQQSKESYSYTQVVEYYHREFPREKGSINLEHKSGHEVFIDFAGKKLQIINRQAGEIIPI